MADYLDIAKSIVESSGVEFERPDNAKQLESLVGGWQNIYTTDNTTTYWTSDVARRAQDNIRSTFDGCNITINADSIIGGSIYREFNPSMNIGITQEYLDWLLERGGYNQQGNM